LLWFASLLTAIIPVYSKQQGHIWDSHVMAIAQTNDIGTHFPTLHCTPHNYSIHQALKRWQRNLPPLFVRTGQRIMWLIEWAPVEWYYNYEHSMCVSSHHIWQ
jgi:hypothetical protein